MIILIIPQLINFPQTFEGPASEALHLFDNSLFYFTTSNLISPIYINYLYKYSTNLVLL